MQDVDGILTRSRTCLGIESNSELARKLGKRPATISAWKQGLNEPDYGKLFDLILQERPDTDLHWVITGTHTAAASDKRVSDLEAQVRLLRDLLAEAQKSAFLSAAKELCKEVADEFRRQPAAREGLPRDRAAATNNTTG